MPPAALATGNGRPETAERVAPTEPGDVNIRSVRESKSKVRDAASDARGGVRLLERDDIVRPRALNLDLILVTIVLADTEDFGVELQRALRIQDRKGDVREPVCFNHRLNLPQCLHEAQRPAWSAANRR